jgi:mono/diheme cytochrome c family protein
VRALAIVGILTGLAAGCDHKVAGGSVDGARVFKAACSTCHGERGTPPPQMRDSLGVRDLAGAEWIARRTRARVVEQVRRGAANGRMPAFTGALSDAQIEAVADHVMTLGSP